MKTDAGRVHLYLSVRRRGSVGQDRKTSDDTAGVADVEMNDTRAADGRTDDRRAHASGCGTGGRWFEPTQLYHHS